MMVNGLILPIVLITGLLVSLWGVKTDSWLRVCSGVSLMVISFLLAITWATV